MKVSREQVLENKKTILEAAGRLFRERGFESVTVADVMKSAGLTHGGFYGYFKSKDDLIAQALAEVLGRAGTPPADLTAYAARYLSPSHRNNVAGGCPVAALASETIRQPGGARAEMTAGLKHQIERLSRIAPGADQARKRRAAIGSWAAMVGAMILARMSDDSELSDEVLSETRAWLAAHDQRRPKARTKGRNARRTG
ncbi:MAG TPA: helix-turn-helix domain-containing protein [Dongiaceae bacterium]|jgi:TetR/AcrR family transcriptional repressor of nem operon|nr:helix-turn-helix domain-containing protein [Dongiaceae bacterium]